MRLASSILLAWLLLLARPVGADAQAQARALYARGQAEFEAGRFQQAYDAFRAGYLAARVPAFLYNMASALERLERPHDAAEELRAFLRAVGTTEDHAEIESRIRALDEAQRIIDLERLKQQPPRLVALPPPASRWGRRAKIATGVSIAIGAVAIGLGVGLGIGLRRDYETSTLGTQRVTP